MVTGVGKPVESLRFRLLGPLRAVARRRDLLTLPASRKVRALLGYLVLASRPVTRSQICELLWDVPNDPRGELRWCLSKIRGLIDEKDRKRVLTDGSNLRLDLVRLLRGHTRGHTGSRARHPEVRRRAAEGRWPALFGGELLEGLEIARSPSFDAWITAERRRFRGIQAVLLENLARALPHEPGRAIPRRVAAALALRPQRA